MKKKLNVISAILFMVGFLMIFGVLIAISFNFDKLFDTTEETVNINQDFGSISIDTEGADVIIKPSTDGKCTMSTKCVSGSEIEYSVQNGQLKIRETDDSFEGLFSVGSSSLVLYLPKKAYEELKINGSSGDTDISGIEFDTAEIAVSSGDVKISSNIFALSISVRSGDVSLENMKATSVSIDGTTGDMELISVEVAKNLSIKASTADVELLNSTVGENLSVELSTGELSVKNTFVGNLFAQASTGEIELEGLISEGKIKLKATTGDIVLDGCDASALEIETSTGDVTGKLLSSKIFYAISSTGDISVPVSDKGGICQIKTSTGDITMKIE